MCPQKLLKGVCFTGVGAGADGERKGNSQGSRPPGMQSGLLKSYGGTLATVTKGWKENRHGVGGCARGQAKGCKVDGADSVPLIGTHAPEAPKPGRAWQRPSPAPPLSSKSGSEMARGRTLRMPLNTVFGPTRRAKCAQAPGARPGPSRGPQCSGQHSFRSLDAFSLGMAVHRRYRFRARTILHPPQTRRAVLQDPLSCPTPTPLAFFHRPA